MSDELAPPAALPVAGFYVDLNLKILYHMKKLLSIIHVQRFKN